MSGNLVSMAVYRIFEKLSGTYLAHSTITGNNTLSKRSASKCMDVYMFGGVGRLTLSDCVPGAAMFM
jgi:hypothetical protein